MSRPVAGTPADSVTREAVAWLVRVGSDAATSADWIALSEWLERSPAHAAAYDLAERLSAEIDDRLGEIAESIDVSGGRAFQFARRERRGWLAAGLIAASLLAAAMIGPLLNDAYRGPPTTYRTGAGQTRLIALQDGSRVQLNASSSMTVRMGLRARSVVLDSAEASFDVAKDPRRPFRVIVGDQRVQVVGTEFNIRHMDRSTTVTVRRGLVDVIQPDLGSQPIARLAAGMELRHVEGTSTSPTRAVDPNRAFLWATATAAYNDRPLAEIVAALNQRYAPQIRVTEAAGRRQFTGVLVLGEQDILVHRLADYLSLHATRTDAGYSLD